MTASLSLAPSAWYVFVPFGALHAVTVAVCALLIVAPTLLGRALRKDAELALRRTLAALAVGYWLGYVLWWDWHGRDLHFGLPLHICNFAGLVAPFALLTGQRWARATLYFWTSVLTVQAFIQPMLAAGPAWLVFWAFWAMHTIIAVCAVYDIAVLGFRPRWSDLWRAMAVTAAYVALVVPVDLWLGANYGYLGNPQAHYEIPPFVDALGPWPQRAIVLVVLVAIGFFVALLPWLIAARRSQQERSAMSGRWRPQ